ncbi:MAG: FAD-binding protein, partial [Planctomycetaceae bacterium]|nr:FAD-binding protein [Planctomycetaceae bacterium]
MPAVNDQQQRISEDLHGQFSGEVRVDPLTISMYSTDASLYEIKPLAVAYPKSAEDVSILAAYAEEEQLELTARGAGSGLAGGALGRGIIVDFSKHMNRIEQIGTETVRVEPGVVCSQLNRALAQQGRYFPPDPSNAGITTLGGMMGVDAAGSHAVRVGSTRDHVLSLDVVLAGGERIEAGSIPLEALQRITPSEGPVEKKFESAFHQLETQQSALRDRLSKLVQLLRDNHDLIERYQPPMIRNCSGYQLRGVLRDQQLNLSRLMVGSEGTLGIFTSAVLHTSPRPEHRGVVLLLFGDLFSALEAVSVIGQLQPSACDLLDRRVLGLGRESGTFFQKIIPETAEAGLLVEQTGNSQNEVRDRIASVLSSLQKNSITALKAAEAFEADEVDFLWTLPGKVVPRLTRLKGNERPLPFVEDIAVPPEVLPEFFHRAQRVLQKHEVTTSIYAHAASGQIHIRPFLSAPKEADGERLESLARDLYQIVFHMRGTISGEHGDGLSRTSFLRSQYGPLYKLFQQVKDIFDPHNLMNPGKIISDDPHLTRRHFREIPADPKERPASPETVELQLRWDEESVADASMQCNGCGQCRTQEPGLRMCPFFRITPDEEASPRSKANLLRDYLTNSLSSQDFTSDEMLRVASLCFNCKQCELECPSRVDIPKMMIEARASYVQMNGLSRADWILSRAHSFGALGCVFPPLSNWMLSNRFSRWLIELTLGISRHRRLPKFARQTFAQKYARRNPPRPQAGDQNIIILFTDSYVDYHDPELGQAFVAICEHHGYEVYVPPEQQPSGMAMISAGDLDSVETLVEQNLRILGEFAREGFPIVTTEPAAALCLTQEYPNLTDHPDTGVVAESTVDAGRFLSDLNRNGKLKTDFHQLDKIAGYHTPCHTKALG